MANQQNQASLDQSQLHRDAASNQEPSQNASFLDQASDSVKTMAHGAADVAGGAASGVAGIARGAAMGAANVAEGAAGAVKNTFGSNTPSK
ncbi:protein FAM71B-like isoform X2 [Cynara cardunculus var. scolymus]|uniref:protein FAM71B-like isoform X2 n=1 Tax=Cynara cardunculus var. scolymus TaxID=59895 RepID=UPI000D6280C0|nr:protein FAM71B-like isoform X2 [Cynara cardunculus var. scolymus]